jgi:predicted TIM-barrel fold metal-dependent hydrolase
MDDSRMDRLYAFAAERKLPVLVHVWIENNPYSNQEIFSKVAVRHPDIKWIMGHSGGQFSGIRAVEVAKKIVNVYLDITMSRCPARQIEYFVQEVGSERVLFGTDNPYLDPRPHVGRVALAEISREDKVNIFGANARRLANFRD